DALLINFSNPLPRLTRAVTRYTGINVVGKCHQIKVGYAIVAALLGDKVGIDVPPGVRFHSDASNMPVIGLLGEQGHRHFAIKAAGLNHFTWMLDVRRREDGADVYPALRAAAANAPAGLDPLTMDLFRVFGYCPVPGDTHLAEYLPWTHDPVSKPWERYEIPLYDWGGNEMFREFSHHRLAQMASGALSV